MLNLTTTAVSLPSFYKLHVLPNKNLTNHEYFFYIIINLLLLSLLNTSPQMSGNS